MIYKIVHRTTYRYRFPVSLGNHVACLKPRDLLHQRLVGSALVIEPAPATLTERIDYFGNALCFFTVQEPHRELVVETHSEVERDAARPNVRAPEANVFAFGRSLQRMLCSRSRLDARCWRRCSI
jgi:transglutaminase-like putative cysteine protease